MRNKHSFLALMLVIFSLLSAFSAFSLKYYNETGAANNYFNAGSTIFNSNYNDQFTTPNIYAALTTRVIGTPLVSDLNNDGIKEIIVNDAGTLKIYHNKNLNLVDSATLGTTSDTYSPVYSYDIDNDGFREILVLNNNVGNVSIFKYNTSLQFINSLNVTAGAKAGGASLLKCRSPNQCVALYSSASETTHANFKLLITSFNSTEKGTSEFIIPDTGATASNVIFPRVPYITAADYDSDGSIEYIFTYYRVTGGLYGVLAYANQYPNNSVFIERSIFPAGLFSSATCLTQQCITDPLVFDASPGGTLETIIGIQTAANAFEMKAYNAISGEIATYPSASTAEGQILSNPMKINAFSEDKSSITDKQNDYCIMGYKTSNNIDLLCGSIVSSFGFFNLKNIEYFAPIINFNISSFPSNLETLSNTISAESDILNSNNMDEVLNAYGVIKLTTDDCDVSGCVATSCSVFTQCKMEITFENIAFNSVIVPIDLEDIGFDDYLAQTNASLYYIDDKLTNEPPSLCVNSGDCKINPCNPVKTNTSMSITITAIDDFDQVSYNVIFYYGTTNQFETGFTPNLTSGRSAILAGNANQTISNGIIRFQVTDSSNPIGHLVSHDEAFSVLDNGFNLGDCQNSITGTSTVEAEANASSNIITSIQSNNAITTGTAAVASQFGLSSQLVWLVLMLVIAICIWFYSHLSFPNMDSSAIFGLVVFSQIMLFIIGALLGFISTGIIILIIMIGIVLISWYIRKKWTGTAS